jgi:hypothetical protein
MNVERILLQQPQTTLHLVAIITPTPLVSTGKSRIFFFSFSIQSLLISFLIA